MQKGQGSHDNTTQTHTGQILAEAKTDVANRKKDRGGRRGSAKSSFLKKNGLTLFLILVFVIGLSLLLYPNVSDYLNSLHQTKAIQAYEETVEQYSEEDLQAIWDAAVEYNERLHEGSSWSITLKTDEEIEDYESQLNLNGDGMMGYVEIPKISVYLPIYHGTDDSILARNVGHLEGTYLPVGGKGTHCVISGHRGLTNARLFTDLDKLVVGDTFKLYILDQTLTYEVDQVLTTLPEEISALAPVVGEDYCTLVTCSPYGVNSHRMLVRGHRIDNDSDTIHITGDALKLDSILVAPVVAAPILLVLLILLLWTTRPSAKVDHYAKVRRELGIDTADSAPSGDEMSETDGEGEQYLRKKERNGKLLKKSRRKKR